MVVESVLEEMSENSCLSNATVATLLEELEVPVPSSLFKDLSQSVAVVPTGCLPRPSTRGKAGRNQWNEEITPLLLTGIGERFSQTISNLGDVALLRRGELPL